MAPPGTAREKKSQNKPQARKQSQPQSNNARSQNANSIPDGKTSSSVTPIWLQQAILDVFSTSFGSQDANELRDRIQKVKGCLYNRDFLGAFESEENQEAYCLRWSPSRALAYAELLCAVPEVRDHLSECVSRSNSSQRKEDDRGPDESTHRIITCIGGGAGAEGVAFAAALKYASTNNQDATTNKRTPEEGSETTASNADALDASQTTKITINAIDIAAWTTVLSKLDTGIETILSDLPPAPTPPISTPTLSPLTLPSTTLPRVTFHHADILTLPSSQLAPLITSAINTNPPLAPSSPPSPCPSLITILFTLNELYSTSLPRTTSFLLTLTSLCVRGTLLLVVDSPGSYSTVKLGETEKKYPMQWMLDHTLLQQASKVEDDADGVGGGTEAGRGKGKAGEGRRKAWEKVRGEESRWWRMDRAKLRYAVPGVELEDMRMQWHLFRRL